MVGRSAESLHLHCSLLIASGASGGVVLVDELKVECLIRKLCAEYHS